MPPKRELSIRLRAELREALDQAATERGQTLTAIVEDALAQFLGVDGPEPGQTLADRVRGLEQRVATLEGTAMQRNATQDIATQRDARQRNATPQTAPTEGQYQADGVDSSALLPGVGVDVGEALIAAGAPISPHIALGDNRSRAMVAATGQTAAAWLESQGWVKEGRQWHPPS